MAQVVLFHHAHGLTPGVLTFAEELRHAGHTVHTPDLFDGLTFVTVQEGVQHAGEVGFGTLIERGVDAVSGLPSDLVYAGFSLGVLPAQCLAQTRPGARGALLFHAAIPIAEFGLWPAGVPVQIHAMDNDPFFQEDKEAAQDLVATVGAELFIYPGEKHLFADNSLADFDTSASSLMMERVLPFLASIG